MADYQYCKEGNGGNIGTHNPMGDGKEGIWSRLGACIVSKKAGLDANGWYSEKKDGGDVGIYALIDAGT